ncbi:DUF4170 domain-containing protein [Inquilinus sp. Marseille-Q2685]|uniref:DUF4170 domain-containing protein n=1 Tax=Inquilinus sp. Marseille-Q2685 TaxID=2866581 RepID=UPI001CE3B624|nr:DUF4170 domain-containing protein [Inquilinus sp. Marseille-Q2685]
MTTRPNRFWIIGGEYADTRFDRLIDGTESLQGPFDNYDEALHAWRQLASATTSNAHQRYTIAHEGAR